LPTRGFTPLALPVGYLGQNERSCSGHFAAGLIEEFGGLQTLEFLDVVLVFQDRAERVGNNLRRKGHDVEGQKAFGPVDGFGRMASSRSKAG
jgi:hypothetical protein